MLTVLIYVVMIIYAQMKLQKLYFRSDTTHTEAINRNVVSPEEKFTFEQMGFNVGFSLWNNDFTEMHDMSLIEDYVRFEATLNEFDFTDGRVYNQTVLNMVPCSEKDFHPPIESDWDEVWT